MKLLVFTCLNIEVIVPSLRLLIFDEFLIFLYFLELKSDGNLSKTMSKPA